MAAKKEGGVSDRAHAGRGALGLDLRDERGAFVAIGSLEAEFHQLAGLEQTGEFAKKVGVSPAFPTLMAGSVVWPIPRRRVFCAAVRGRFSM